ncbi:MAG: histidine phosphatase family protein [Rhizobacter sp.]
MLYVWRHPKAIGADGRCIGITDLRVDPRKAKRLAHVIRGHARRHALPPLVWTSPLRRSADVGRWLARWGWSHRVDTALVEIDFGAWDGLTWDEIGASAVTAWCADFALYRAHGGESVSMLFDRCASWIAEAHGSSMRCVVGHAGWINAARLLQEGGGVPSSASAWPPPMAHGRRFDLSRKPGPSDCSTYEGGP